MAAPGQTFQRRSDSAGNKIAGGNENLVGELGKMNMYFCSTKDNQAEQT